MSENYFFTFLLGTHKVKGNQNIQHLPQEIRHKIWLEYAASTLPYSEIIEKELLEVLELKLEREKSDLPPTLDFVLFKQPLVQSLFELACRKMKLEAMTYLFKKYGKRVFPSDDMVYKFWTNFFNICPPEDYLPVLQWLREKEFKFNSYVYNYAIFANDLDVVKWLVENVSDIKPCYNNLLLLFRKHYGSFMPEMAKYLFDKFPDFCNYAERLVGHIVNVDNIDGLIFITSYEGTKHLHFDWQNMMMTACFYSSFYIMDWINKTRPEFNRPNSICDGRVLGNAISTYNYKVIAWLYDNRPEFRLSIDEYRSRSSRGSHDY